MNDEPMGLAQVAECRSIDLSDGRVAKPGQVVRLPVAEIKWLTDLRWLVPVDTPRGLFVHNGRLIPRRRFAASS
jgi:hypothetical protein